MIKKWTEIKSVIGLLVAMVGLQLGTVIATTINTVEARQLKETVTKINQEYMPYILAIDFMQSFQDQLLMAGVLARKDSASFMIVSQKYDDLRLQWMRDLKVVRGFNNKVSSSNGGAE